MYRVRFSIPFSTPIQMLSFREFEVYDFFDNQLPLSVYSSTGTDSSFPLENSIDGDLNTYTYTDSSNIDNQNTHQFVYTEAFYSLT